MMRFLILGLSLVVGAFSLNTLFAQPAFTDQADIPSWGLTASQNLVTAGVINGNTDGSLAPWRQINRAEFLKVLVTATGTPTVNVSQANFPDVSSTDWFAPYVHTAVKEGWAKGYPDGTFGPGRLINRAEIAKLISEAWSMPQIPNASDTNWYDVYSRSLRDRDALPYRLTINNFVPAKNPPRIEVFEQLDRVISSDLSEAEEVIIIPALEEAPTPEETTTASTTNSTSETNTSTEPSTSTPTETEPTETPTTDPTPPPIGSDGGVIIPDEETEEAARPGNFYVQNLSGTGTQIVYPGQGGVTALSASLMPTENFPEITAITFTHTGSSPIPNFSRMWLYDDANRISEEVIPTGSRVKIKLEPKLVLKNGRNFYLKIDTAGNAQAGFQSRWSIASGGDIETTSFPNSSYFPVAGPILEFHPE